MDDKTQNQSMATNEENSGDLLIDFRTEQCLSRIIATVEEIML